MRHERAVDDAMDGPVTLGGCEGLVAPDGINATTPKVVEIVAEEKADVRVRVPGALAALHSRLMTNMFDKDPDAVSVTVPTDAGTLKLVCSPFHANRANNRTADRVAAGGRSVRSYRWTIRVGTARPGG